MRLSLQAFDTPNGNMIGDWSGAAVEVEIQSGIHGFLSLTAVLDLPNAAAVSIYDRAAPAHIVAGDGSIVAFEGRLEDKRLSDGRLNIGALGYWRAFYDVPYSALWSDSGYGSWRILTADDNSNLQQDRHEQDNNNRLYIAPRKGEDFSTGHMGAFGYEIPSQSARQIVRLEFDYAFKASSDWIAKGRTASGWTPASGGEWTLTGDGTEQTGSVTKDWSSYATDQAIFYLYYNNGTPAEYTGETGDTYLKITSIRITTVAAAAIYGDDIAGALVDFVNGINSSQIQDSDLLITSPAVDIDQAIYLDQLPGDILIALAAAGDDSTPPLRYETGVWEDRRLYFRQAGSAAREWQIDADLFALERSIDTLINSAYTLYDSGKQRTANDSDAASVARHGLTRRRHTVADTTSATTAAVYRDALIEASADGQARAEIVARHVYDNRGAPWPGYAVRAGDTVTIRNLPPDLAALAEFRQFTAAGTRFRYNDQGSALSIIPDYLRTLETIISEV